MICPRCGGSGHLANYKWLREERLKHNVSLRSMASMLQISSGHLSRVERGIKTLSTRLNTLYANTLNSVRCEKMESDDVQP
jgi:transcriptional regulator with XRE-family HTH domain